MPPWKELSSTERMDLIKSRESKRPEFNSRQGETLGKFPYSTRLIIIPPKKQNNNKLVIFNPRLFVGHRCAQLAAAFAHKYTVNSLYSIFCEALWDWFQDARGLKMPLSGPMIQEKALSFPASLGQTGFKASNGWFGCFNDVEPVIVDNWKAKLPEIQLAMHPRTSLTWMNLLVFRALPDRSLSVCDDGCTGGKKCKHCITISLTVNMEGDFEKTAVIGKAAKLHVFFPANTTSILQSLDQGIIKNVKMHYRRSLLPMVLGEMFKGVQASQVAKSINILHAVTWIHSSINMVRRSTVQSCFANAGFSVDEPVEEDPDDDVPLAHAEEYSAIDSDGPSTEDLNEGQEELLVEEFLPGTRDTEEQDTPEKDQEEQPTKAKSSFIYADALGMLGQVKNFFLDHELEYLFWSYIDLPNFFSVQQNSICYFIVL
uniref:HTH CENPB-type domain-containing protein n=1 Tax=Callorhinchus milii TaxID=7868 RepID=A0A4W3JWA6_CALMI